MSQSSNIAKPSHHSTDIENRWDLVFQQFQNKNPEQTDEASVVSVSDVSLSQHLSKSISLRSSVTTNVNENQPQYKKSKSLPQINKIILQSLHAMHAIHQRRETYHNQSLPKRQRSLSYPNRTSESLKRRISFADSRGSPLVQLHKMQNWYHSDTTPSRGRYKKIRRRSHTLPNSQFTVDDSSESVDGSISAKAKAKSPKKKKARNIKSLNTPVRRKMRRSLSIQLDLTPPSSNTSSTRKKRHKKDVSCVCIVL